jgi:hypothetical protein
MGISQHVFDELEPLPLPLLLPLLHAAAAATIAAQDTTIQAHDTMIRFMRAPLSKNGSPRR